MKRRDKETRETGQEKTVRDDRQKCKGQKDKEPKEPNTTGDTTSTLPLVPFPQCPLSEQVTMFFCGVAPPDRLLGKPPIPDPS